MYTFRWKKNDTKILWSGEIGTTGRIINLFCICKLFIEAAKSKLELKGMQEDKNDVLS